MGLQLCNKMCSKLICFGLSLYCNGDLLQKVNRPQNTMKGEFENAFRRLLPEEAENFFNLLTFN